MPPKILAMVMAGGRGERLYPLTMERSKPAVPFGGKYRIVDFVLSNLVNSGICSVYVLTQFKAQSLIRHVEDGWSLNSWLMRDQFITAVPAQMRTGDNWYQGTADAVFQNLYLIERFRPDIVAVFGADHVYRMDISQMVAYHMEKGARCTVATVPFNVDEARGFGIVEVDEDWRIVRFEEKPPHPTPLPHDPTRALVSMGNYLFNTDTLFELLSRDASKETNHDFGRDILPSITEEGWLYAYDFSKNRIPGPSGEESTGYWRDIATIDAYWRAHLDLRAPLPSIDLYSEHWPIRTPHHHYPPAKFTWDDYGRSSNVINSIVCEGCVISGSTILGSVLGRRVVVRSSEIMDCVVLSNVTIEGGSRIRRAIIDKYNVIPAGTAIGYNLDEDKKKYFISEEGTVVIPRGQGPAALCSPG